MQSFQPQIVEAETKAALDEYKPRKGDSVTYYGQLVGHVTRVEGNMCHYRDLNGIEQPSGLFIWRFKEKPELETKARLNSLFSWPAKDRAMGRDKAPANRRERSERPS